MDKLFKDNYNPLLEKCKEKFQTWSVHPLSLIGKINAIKMSILPKFIYAFNMLHAKKCWNLDAMLSRFQN